MMFLKIIEGDVLKALKRLPDESVNTIITSPPYYSLRNYNVEGQIGLEPTLEEYLDKLLKVTAELKRVLRKDGVLFWNHGDSYNNQSAVVGRKDKTKYGGKTPIYSLRGGVKTMPAKCLTMQNYRLAIRMVDEQGWSLRNRIIWAKRVWVFKENDTIGNAMPESVKDRFAKSYEPVFFFTKNRKYWFDLDAVRLPHKESTIERAKHKFNSYKGDIQGAVKHTGQRKFAENLLNGKLLGKNPGDVWQINTQPSKFMHFAVMPESLVEPLIKVGCPKQICKKCGKPRERIIISERVGASQKRGGHVVGGDGVKVGNVYNVPKEVAKKEFVGWTDCGCNAGWREGVVLDPFMGSGTTLVVARRLGCSAIGIELNPDYVKIAKKRLNWGVGLDVEFQYEVIR